MSRNEKKPTYESETLLYTPEKSTLKGTLLHWPVMAQWLKLTEGDEQTARNFRYCALKHAEIRLFKPARDAKLVSQEINFWTWKGPSQGTDLESRAAKQVEKLDDAERVAQLKAFGFSQEDAEAQVAKLRAQAESK